MSASVATILAPGETACEGTDRLPRDLRALVHDYGYSVVNQFVSHGIRDASAIRHLIRAVHQGAREPGNKRPAAVNQAGRKAEAALDTWLVTHGATFTARMLIRAIRDSGHTVLPIGGTKAMQAAYTYTSGDVGRRLQAVMDVGDLEAWGER